MPADEIRIRPLERADADGCLKVIASLPYFFGDPSGVAECATALQTQSGYVAERHDEILGFVALTTRFGATTELTWMAVHAGWRRRGIGRRLMRAVVAGEASRPVSFLAVLTLSPSCLEPGVVDGYKGTRRFYRREGFLPVMEYVPAGWSSPAVLLIAAL
ncbi:MAG TPA: GNAT family N-acetyltransferase [Kribbella sp.]|nr:GNAT family N-acetyltransferase [Kribbella sp.]